MPVVPDHRTGKPEYFCDDCGQMAHWGIAGGWFCREHKEYTKAAMSGEPSPKAGLQAEAFHAGTGNGMPAGHAAVSEGRGANAPATIRYGGGRNAGKTARLSDPRQTTLF